MLQLRRNLSDRDERRALRQFSQNLGRGDSYLRSEIKKEPFGSFLLCIERSITLANPQ
jgi:hypothetical protein